MLTARTIIIAVVLLVVVSLLASVLSMLQPPDNDGLLADSYGTRSSGYRAIYEVLDELDIDVQRALVPPTSKLDSDTTVVVWGPDGMLIGIESAPLHRVGEWLKQGGRVVVTQERAVDPLQQGNPFLLDVPEGSAREELGVPVARVESATMIDELATPTKPTRRGFMRGNELKLGESFGVSVTQQMQPLARVEVEFHGDLKPLAADVHWLDVPAQIDVLDLGDTDPSGWISVKAPGIEPVVIAARYKVGEGEAIVVADPKIFDNQFIAREDNAVLAVRLLAGERGTVVWDEFYHGLTIRGNPLFLLTRGSYAMVALMVILATAAWVWRSAIFLGPHMAAPAAPRRSLAEYVEAMARFLRRGPGSSRFAIEQFREGILWELRRKLRMPPGNEKADDVVAALSRRDPAAASRLLDAVRAVDLSLSRSSRIHHRQALLTMKGLNDCL